MRAIRALFLHAIALFACLALTSPSWSVPLPEIEPGAQSYATALKGKHGGRNGLPSAQLQRLSSAVEGQKWSEAVRLLEELSGRALGGQVIPGASAADLLHRLADAWHKHQSGAEEGLWAAYLAQTMPPRDRGPGNLETLVVAGHIILAQITSLHADFDYRGFTLGKIAERLEAIEYSPSRIVTEEAQGRLPSEVRELLDLKGREERERMLLVEKLTTRMNLANTVYQEIARSSAHANLGDGIRKAVEKKLFYVKEVYANTGRADAAICLEFNLPLRSDAGEYRDMVKALVREEGGKATQAAPATERTVKDATLCLHGLHHGQAYHILAQKGLPSKSGAVLSSDFDTRVEKTNDDTNPEVEEATLDAKTGLRIPDRAPSAGFRSLAYILPKFGGGSVPLTTVNVDRVELELLRLSDRTLYRQLALNQTETSITTDNLKEFRKLFSDPYWSGGLDLHAQPNRTVTTDLPIRQLLDDRNRELAFLRDKELTEPFTSQPVTTGPLRGRFRVDRLSAGAPDMPPDERGIYAFVAKPSTTYSSLSDTDHNGEYLTGSGPCTDEETQRVTTCSLSVQWFVVTDLGLTYYLGPEKLHVIARSLSTGQAVKGATIQLLAANNRVLGESITTDEHGVATFESRFARGSDGNRLAALTALNGEDFSFVTFSSRDVFDLSDHGIAGRRPPGWFDAYVYSDRGVYRPEEKIHATLLIRDPNGNAAETLPPIVVKLKASNGKIVEEKTLDAATWHLGGTAVDLTIPASVPLGQADILVHLGQNKEPIGSATVQLDHFRPDRARISLAPDSAWQITTTRDQAVVVRGGADAQYLYGIRSEGSSKTDAPAANLTGEVAMLIRPAPSPFQGCYDGFKFGRAESELTPLLHRAALSNRTGANGDLAFETTARLPGGDHPLEATLTLTLFDEGGKVGQQSRAIHIPVERPWLGVRPEARLLPDKGGMFQLKLGMIALDARNNLRSSRLRYRIWQERDIFIWHQDSNSWRYQPDVQRSLIKEGDILARETATTGERCKPANAEIAVELGLGRYYIEVQDGTEARVTFSHDAGWAGAGLYAPTPDRLAIYSDAHREADLASFRPGQQATFKIEAPFDGEVLLALANNQVHRWEGRPTRDRQAVITFRIPPDWAGDAFYALATVYRRNTDGTVSKGPARAIGATYFTVDREAERRLKLEISNRGLEQVQPDRPVEITLRSEGLQGRAWATVYAVDEGLLSLNNHAAPNPFGHFFGQHRIGLEVLDNYGRILLTDKASRDRAGGDRSRRLFLANYTSDRILAEFAGPVEFVNGEAIVRFPTPFNFNGTVRLSAVAWTDRKVGAATRSIVQRQRIVADLRTPRFLTPGDHATIGLKVWALDTLPSRYRVSVVPQAPLKVEALRVADGGGKTIAPGIVELDLPYPGSRSIEAVVSVPPDSKPATSEIRIDINGAADDVKHERPVTRSFTIAVRPVEAPTTDIAFMTLQGNEEVELTAASVLDLARGRFVEQNLAMQLYASADPLGVLRRVSPPGQVHQVGMLERIVWQGMMQLHSGQPNMRSAVPSLVRQIEALQAADGYYDGYRLSTETGLHESSDIFDRSNHPVGRFERHKVWRTALALDFLAQARNAGYAVSEPGLEAGVRVLRENLRTALENAPSGGDEELETVSDAEARQGDGLEEVKSGTPERRTIQQILFPSHADAEAAFNKIKNGAAFETIAAERNIPPRALEIGTFTKGEMVDPAVAEAAFSLQPGATSSPIAGRFGSVIVRVTQIRPETVGPERPVADMKTAADQVHPRLVEDRDTPAQAEERNAVGAGARPTDAPKAMRSAEMIAKLLRRPQTEDTQGGADATQADDSSDDASDAADATQADDSSDDASDAADATQVGDSSDDAPEDTSAPYYLRTDACDEDILYSAFILARQDAIDRFDLSALITYCGRQPLRPVAAAMLAAALRQFGVVEEARGVLASIDPRGGAISDAAASENRFDAMMYAFLALADAKAMLRTELAHHLLSGHWPLSLPTRAWLVRAYAELPANTAEKPFTFVVKGSLGVEMPTEYEVLSETVLVADLPSRRVVLRNPGTEPVTVALVLHGTPSAAAGAPHPELEVTRSVISRDGQPVDLQRTKLVPNDLLYIILSGERTLDASGDETRLQDPVAIIDRLPAGFEIVDTDIFAMARSEGVGLRSVLPSEGKVGRLRVAEAGDDQLLAIVKPAPSGKFQIGYSVRVVSEGQFVHPGTIVEDLYRPEVATHTLDGMVQIEAPRRP